MNETIQFMIFIYVLGMFFTHGVLISRYEILKAMHGKVFHWSVVYLMILFLSAIWPKTLGELYGKNI